MITGEAIKELLVEDITLIDLNFFNPPEHEDLYNLNPIYLSYFIEWISYKNYLFAKSRGFHDLTHEWRRTHHVEDYDQVDSRAYIVHSWLKYLKFGHQFATDVVSRQIRYRLITSEEGIELVKKYDHNLDLLCVRDFCDFCGYTESEFWNIVNKFYNRHLFQKNSYGEWKLKSPIS